jgi:hypothetical protein
MAQVNVLYGYLSGMSAAVALQPLDNIKVALMVPPKDLQTTSNPLRNLYVVCRFLEKEGGISAFYKGTTVSIIKTGISSGIFFWGLRHIEKLFKD